MKYSTVIHIEFKTPINGVTHDFFGSIKAIYNSYTDEQIGITYKSLVGNYSIRKKPYENKNCVISCGEIKRNKQTK